MTDQEHLDQDVAALTSSIAQEVSELKAQIAAGISASDLDFTSLDALVASTQADATADAPPVPVADTTSAPTESTDATTWPTTPTDSSPTVS